MELGKLYVRAQNTNILHEALHPDLGLVWSNSKAIWKAPVKLFSNQVENVESQKLGEFEQTVRSVHWSSNIGPQICYLCVVHTQHISLWKVDGQSTKLGFKQIRKLNLQPIPQGCLWNPGRDILCVLSKQQCSFFFRHTQKKGSYAFPPVENGKIHCGTWSRDGSMLVVCVGAVLLIYTWPDIDTSVSNVTPAAWRIPSLDSNVYSVVSLWKNMIVCAAELPLESLCKEQNMFEAPDVPDQTSLENNNEHDEIISPKTNHSSLKDALLNLPRSSKNSIEDTSQMIAVKLPENKEPCKLFSTGITGLLTPDILHFEEALNVMVVGSNNQGVLQVFTVSQTEFVKLHDIVLENGGRPKGISSVPYDIPGPTKGVLIAVGSKLSTDSALPPSASGTPMDIQMKFYPVYKNNLKDDDAEKDSVEMGRSNGSSPRLSSSDLSSRRYSNELTESESGSITLMKERTLSSGSSNLDSPRDSALQPPPRQKKNTKMKESFDSGGESPREITLIKTTKEDRKLVVDLNKSGSSDDLETESTDFSESKPNFSNNDVSKFFEDSYDDKHFSKDDEVTKSSAGELSAGGQAVGGATTGTSWTDNDEINYKDLQTEINKQDKKIEDLKNRIAGLCRVVEETSVVFPNKYQDMEKPDLVKVICQYEGDVTRKKKFVLDNGRLKLELIKDVFELTVVELYLDGEPCVIGANIDGYIPIRFQPSSTLVITGKHIPKTDQDSSKEEDTP